jgi:selenocysteine-specific elongation factor
MKSVIIGTAGHIDHGKTTLVKALTGIDADRLEEEKRRGITIDIGFAHLELAAPSGERLRFGFVDVPGHERFVRNMLAGIGGIDLVLLVIAADEGIKPQTREHFDICRLLAVRRGITVLTKCDLVDSDTLDVVKLEVQDFLKGSVLESAPMVAVSSLTGAGLEDLKQQLLQVANDITSRDSAALARLPIDRVFTMKGFGTIVTGTLISGTVQKEDELEVFPNGLRVRVRCIQVHGQSAERALAGQRTALNLAGVATEDLSRGMMLAAPATFQVTKRADVSLSLLPSARPLKDRARVHFHAHTWESVAEVVLFREKRVAPGQTTYAQLRLTNPALLLPADRFIIRQFSPVITIGGGVVLDAAPMAKRRAEEADDFLKTMESGTPEQILGARVHRRGPSGLSLTSAIAETGMSAEAMQRLVSENERRGRLFRLGDVLLFPAVLQTLKSDLVQAVEQFHQRNPLAKGMNQEQLRESLKLSPDVLAAVLEMMAGEKKLQSSGDVVHLSGRGIVMKDEETESKKIIEQAFASAGLKVPALKDVIAGLKVDKARAQKIVTLLLRDKVLIKISDDLVFHRNALDDLRQRIAAYKIKSPKIDVAQFKDLTGVSRKYAIPLLEYLDRERVTRRVGDARVIL